MQIRIKKLNALATLPEYAHGPSEDAGLDIRSLEDALLAPAFRRPFLPAWRSKFPAATKFSYGLEAVWP